MGMTSDQIFDALEEIAATSSKNEKQALVAKYGQDGTFKRVLVLALDPLTTYGMQNVPEREAHGDEVFSDETWAVIDSLASRELTGSAALAEVQVWMDKLSKKSSELLKRIIKKDLRAGFGDSTVNKAFKGLIREFPYQRCSLPKDTDLAKWPWADGVFSQEKADGMFANIDHEEGGLVRITSRQGTEFPAEKFPQVVAEVQTRLNDETQYHGEFLVERDGVILERAIGNGVMNSVANGGDFAPNERPIYKVWDAIPLENVVPKGKYEVPYKNRIVRVINNLKAVPGTSIGLIQTKVVRSLKEAYAHAAELMQQGKEGTVIKHPNAIWKDGTSKEQIKLKLEFDVDLEVVSIVPGERDTKNEGRAGSLLCKTVDDKLYVNVTVKNEDMRDRVDANPEDWVGRIIEVKANDVLSPSESNEFHSLFLPRMTEPNYRTDKTVADTLERVFAAKEMAILGETIMKEAA